MISIFNIVLGVIGILFILVYPKIIRLFLFGLIGYFAVFQNWLWGILYIPLLLIMLYFKRKK